MSVAEILLTCSSYALQALPPHWDISEYYKDAQRFHSKKDKVSLHIVRSGSECHDSQPHLLYNILGRN